MGPHFVAISLGCAWLEVWTAAVPPADGASCFSHPVNAQPKKNKAIRRVITREFEVRSRRGGYRRARNQEGSLLLQPLVVSTQKLVLAGSLRSTMPSFCAETAQIFQPSACTPTISQAAWNVPGLDRSPSPSGPRLKPRNRLSGDQST